MGDVYSADGGTYGTVAVERALEMTDERYDPSTGGESRGEAGGSDTASGVTTEATAEAGDMPAGETGSGRSRAHLLERNRLLCQRVQEQAARIEALEAALERSSAGQSAVNSQEDRSAGDAPTEAMSIRRQVEEWLTGGL